MLDLIDATRRLVQNVSIVLFFLIFSFNQNVESISVRVSNLTIGQKTNNLINSNIEDIYRVVYNSTRTTLNITAWTNATSELPLLIVIRQEKGLISLQLPNKESENLVQNVSRILCPAYVHRDEFGLSTVYIDIYTSSQANISYSLFVSYFESFVLNDYSSTSLFVSPFAPVFFKYDMKTESSIVKFTSKDQICTTVSVQRMMCPVFDLKHTVDFAGQYQTMTKLAAISVDNPNFMHKSMYIVVSVHQNDIECCESANCSGSSFHRIKNLTIELLPGYDHSTVNLNYAITLSVFLAIYILIFPFLCFVEPYSEKNFKRFIQSMKASEITIGSTNTTMTPTSNTRLFDEKYRINGVADMSNHTLNAHNNRYKPNEFSIIHYSPKINEPYISEVSSSLIRGDEKLLTIRVDQVEKKASIENLTTPSDLSSKKDDDPTVPSKGEKNEETVECNQDVEIASSMKPLTANLTLTLPNPNQPAIEDSLLVNEDNSFSSVDYDKVEDAESYKDVVRNKPYLKVHDLARKQPKLLDRKMMNYPRLIISIATFYVLPVIQLILLYQTQLTKSGNEDTCYFNFLCMIKSGPFAAFNNVFSNVGYVLLGIMFIIVVKKRSYSYTYMRKKYPLIMAYHGVPQHFGLFYTIGIGLIMEGILSAAYHVCPSFNNFQFDTSFMYVIGVISTIKLYQCRHPDIHPSSQKVFLFLALCILINVIGVFYGKTNAWFVISYSIFHIVFFFGLSIIMYYMKRPTLSLNSLREIARNMKQWKKIGKPTHIDRFIMLLIASFLNYSLAIYAILYSMQFSQHLLNVLLGNFMLYFMMYLINKVLKREPFHVITIVNLIVTTIAWIFALYFFTIEIKQWDRKPAESREANRECILLKVYDHHDAWHFLSALSMFMSFVVILTLDDGIILWKRNQIAVF